MVELKKYSSVDSQNNTALLSIASGPVIIKDNKVLLDKHGDDDFWKFPGGRMNDDESPLETAKREAKEELGIDIELSGEPFVMTFTREHEGKMEFVILFHYSAQIKNQEITPGEDVREWKWINVDTLPGDCAPNILPTINHFKH